MNEEYCEGYETAVICVIDAAIRSLGCRYPSCENARHELNHIRTHLKNHELKAARDDFTIYFFKEGNLGGRVLYDALIEGDTYKAATIQTALWIAHSLLSNVCAMTIAQFERKG